jgi:S1-C subfamily serine protease
LTKTLPDAIDAIRPSIVQILVLGSDSERIVLGTGFFVHPDGYALTAKHVIEKAKDVMSADPGSRLFAGLAIPNVSTPQINIRGSFQLIGCDLVECDPRHDLALLRLSPNPFTTGTLALINTTPGDPNAVRAGFGLASLASDRPRDGEAIAVSGYPMAVPVLITTTGVVASSWGTDIANVVPPNAPPNFVIPEICDSYFADVAVNPGNSGGPAYLAGSGSAIGVCIAFRIAEAVDASGAFLRYNSGLSIVVPIKYGIELLGRNADLGQIQIPGSRSRNGAARQTTHGLRHARSRRK